MSQKAKLPDPAEVLALIKSKRSIRFYRPDSIPDDKLNMVLEAGRWSPTSVNAQGTDIIVVRDERIRQRLLQIPKENSKYPPSDADIYWDFHPSARRCIDYKGHYDFVIRLRHLDPKIHKPEQLYNAPIILVPVADGTKVDAFPYIEPWGQPTIRLAMMIENMMLMAWSLGLATVVYSILDPWKVRSVLNIPGHFNLIGIIPIGYPVYVDPKVTGPFMDSKGIFPRRPLKDMVHYDQFDLKKWLEYNKRDPFAWRITNAERKRRVLALGGEWPEGWPE